MNDEPLTLSVPSDHHKVIVHNTQGDVLWEWRNTEEMTADLREIANLRASLSIHRTGGDGTDRPGLRRFVLQREEDETGVSGTGVVAEGVAFSSGVVALVWLSEWPTSVVFHDRGVESVEAVHGHRGKTKIVWIDE